MDRQWELLVIDDVASLRDLLSEVCARLGAKVHTAADANEGLALARANPRISVALVDKNLPGMSGLDATKQLKQIIPDLAVIIVTGYPSYESAVEAIAAGASEYLQKPFDLNQLRMRVSQAAGKVHLGRQAADLQAKLAESEERGRVLLEATSDAIFVFDKESRTLDPANAKARQLQPDFEALIKTRDPSAGRLTLPRPGAPQLILDFSREQVSLSGRPCEMWVIRDMTAVERVRQDQKLEALGRLAAGVSHDFNNMLAVILGNVSLLLQDAKQGDASYNDLLDIQDAASRSVEITRQLLLFARSAPEKRTPIDPNAALASMRTLLARLVGEGITLELELVNNAWPMLIDSGELGQAIVNLASNARDAMGGSGKLILRTENLAHPGGQGLAPGDYVCITVQDSGHGMDDATLQRIFEPFFTTKEKGKGTGLGLAVVHGFAQRHGGRVMVHSRLGQGTSFSLYFPRCDANASDQTRSEGQVAQGKGETILVCEDEEIVGRVLERTLARLGYTVMTARNGRELISVVKAHSGSIHLILSDVVMAGLSGPEAVALLAEEGAVPPVLFMSGYADFGAHHVSPLLRKPFVVKELASKIRAMLDA